MCITSDNLVDHEIGVYVRERTDNIKIKMQGETQAWILMIQLYQLLTKNSVYIYTSAYIKRTKDPEKYTIFDA